MSDLRVIKVSLEVREGLKAIGGKGETYSDIIARLLEPRRAGHRHPEPLKRIEA